MTTDPNTLLSTFRALFRQHNEHRTAATLAEAAARRALDVGDFDRATAAETDAQEERQAADHAAWLAVEHADTLDRWMTRGGTLPDAWCPRTAPAVATMSDADALDLLAAHLALPGQWNGGDVCELAAQLVVATGRPDPSGTLAGDPEGPRDDEEPDTAPPGYLLALDDRRRHLARQTATGTRDYCHAPDPDLSAPEDYTCTLPAGHAGDHLTTDGIGGKVLAAWPADNPDDDEPFVVVPRDGAFFVEAAPDRPDAVPVGPFADRVRAEIAADSLARDAAHAADEPARRQDRRRLVADLLADLDGMSDALRMVESLADRLPLADLAEYAAERLDEPDDEPDDEADRADRADG